MSSPEIDRVDDVVFDYPGPDTHEPLGDLIVWKTEYGFECVASIAHRLFHGVSPDGTWLVMERYPLDRPFDFPAMPEIPESARKAAAEYGKPSSVMQWGGHLYVYVHVNDGYRRVVLA